MPLEEHRLPHQAEADSSAVVALLLTVQELLGLVETVLEVVVVAVAQATMGQAAVAVDILVLEMQELHLTSALMELLVATAVLAAVVAAVVLGLVLVAITLVAMAVAGLFSSITRRNK